MPQQRAEKRALHEEVVHLQCYLPMRPWHIRGRCQNGSEIKVISATSLARICQVPVQLESCPTDAEQTSTRPPRFPPGTQSVLVAQILLHALAH